MSMEGWKKMNIGQQMHMASKVWRQALDARLKPMGLTQAQWLCLLELRRAVEPLAQNDIAGRLGIEAATLVRLLDRLEQRGWVTRVMDNQDRRSKRVLLTRQAIETADRVEEEAARLRLQLLDGLHPEELAVCSKVLKHIHDQALVAY